ncbi:hypothetical protein BKA70DRAFT_1444416 [Coprinopsis sp. MPI-PUGE-AT-0042]|nr:hypothetical protein BKA70DRAFT_1444416 [Coprinopsis sp. MPI-PUGE-AT-0042]
MAFWLLSVYQESPYTLARSSRNKHAVARMFHIPSGHLCLSQHTHFINKRTEMDPCQDASGYPPDRDQCPDTHSVVIAPSKDKLKARMVEKVSKARQETRRLGCRRGREVVWVWMDRQKLSGYLNAKRSLWETTVFGTTSILDANLHKSPRHVTKGYPVLDLLARHRMVDGCWNDPGSPLKRLPKALHNASSIYLFTNISSKRGTRHFDADALGLGSSENSGSLSSSS